MHELIGFLDRHFGELCVFVVVVALVRAWRGR
jgi:hypothetical protein